MHSLSALSYFVTAITIVFVNASAFSITSKTWRMNTNFNSPSNWIGFGGAGTNSQRNCSKNIFSFPMNMEPTVISFPAASSDSGTTTIFAQDILLPSNGYFVFQNGSTILYNSQADSCQSIEFKFDRTTRADWFNANNWIVNGTSSKTALLNWQAVPHVERVPCQYDTVIFPAQSSFHVDISSNVEVSKFFLGDSELPYNDVAFLMATTLGKIQFLKIAETTFDLTRHSWQDTDESICSNYQPDMKRKICSRTTCDTSSDDACSTAFTPHGFCCPICGFHLKIEHRGNLRLIPVKSKLESLVKSYHLDTSSSASGDAQESQVGIYVTRYARKFVHIVFIPAAASTSTPAAGDKNAGESKMKRANVRKLINELKIFLSQDQQVVSTQLSDSWGEDAIPSTDELGSGGLSGGVIFLIVLIVLICGTLLIIYLWNRQGYPPITVNSIMSRIPHLPPMPTLPSFRDIGGTATRGSFTFARFANERISVTNIGQRAAAESSIERAEAVDADITGAHGPMDASPGSAVVGTIDKGGIGFANVTYDIIGGDGQFDGQEAVRAQEKLGSSISSFDEQSYNLVDVTDDTIPIMAAPMPPPRNKIETTEE